MVQISHMIILILNLFSLLLLLQCKLELKQLQILYTVFLQMLSLLPKKLKLLILEMEQTTKIMQILRIRGRGDLARILKQSSYQIDETTTYGSYLFSVLSYVHERLAEVIINNNSKIKPFSNKPQ